MSTSELRQEIKKEVDRMPADRLESLADYVQFLIRPSLERRLSEAEQAIESGQGVNWRLVRRDV
jgi:hypothetical protein